MTKSTWSTAAGVAVAAMLGAGCAGIGHRDESKVNPSARAVEGSQQQSQQALERANEAQKRASEQAKKVAQAQADVRAAQRQLTEAEQKLREEQAKAEQLQAQANQATRIATQQAQQSQQQALQALRRQGAQVSRHEQVIEGQVTSQTADGLTVQPEGGHPLALETNDRTRVIVNGQPATLQDVLEGQNVRVAYQLTGTRPTAISVTVLTPGGEEVPQGTGSSGGRSGSPPSGAQGQESHPGQQSPQQGGASQQQPSGSGY